MGHSRNAALGGDVHGGVQQRVATCHPVGAVPALDRVCGFRHGVTLTDFEEALQTLGHRSRRS
jgi:hypothetical protein